MIQVKVKQKPNKRYINENGSDIIAYAGKQIVRGVEHKIRSEVDSTDRSEGAGAQGEHG